MKAPPFADSIPHRREGRNDKRKGVRTAVAENKVTLQTEREQEAEERLAAITSANADEQRDALSFIRGMQIGMALAKTAQESA